MKKYKTKIESKSTDELIAIVNLEPENWQEDFIVQAKLELEKRGLSKGEIEERTSLLKDNFEEYLWRESQFRANESYRFLEIIFQVLFFYKYLFSNWQLSKYGYKRKAKQRRTALIVGFILYLIGFSYLYFESDKTSIKENQYIEDLILADSIETANTNWTGIYVFSESDGLKTKWELKINKERVHHAVLKINNSARSLVLPCSVVLTEKGIELYPDSFPITLFEITSKYDQLFEFEIQEKDTVTWWSKMKPFDFDDVNGVEAFKKIN